MFDCLFAVGLSCDVTLTAPIVGSLGIGLTIFGSVLVFEIIDGFGLPFPELGLIDDGC